MGPTRFRAWWRQLGGQLSCVPGWVIKTSFVGGCLISKGLRNGSVFRRMEGRFPGMEVWNSLAQLASCLLRSPLLPSPHKKREDSGNWETRGTDLQAAAPIRKRGGRKTRSQGRRGSRTHRPGSQRPPEPATSGLLWKTTVASGHGLGPS